MLRNFETHLNLFKTFFIGFAEIVFFLIWSFLLSSVSLIFVSLVLDFTAPPLPL